MENSGDKLIKKYLDGEEGAFGELIGRYLSPVFNFLFRLVGDPAVAQDLSQETFIKAWKNLEKFDADRNFKTWLFAIARNTAYDYFKKKKTIPFSSFIDEKGNNQLENIINENILPDELLMKKNAAEIMEKQLQEIPKRYQVILMLHYKEDFTLQEIAEILKIPYNTVKSQHQRGLMRLKELLVQI
jgi:RNA polymerase sigma-70 factor, ECF subfamily